MSKGVKYRKHCYFNKIIMNEIIIFLFIYQEDPKPLPAKNSLAATGP